jgi:hypothetical protein
MTCLPIRSSLRFVEAELAFRQLIDQRAPAIQSDNRTLGPRWRTEPIALALDKTVLNFFSGRIVG